MSRTVSRKDRLLGGLWGSLVGDALGVPVEFQDRAMVQADPVTDMRGYGTHNQPPGTWSDDSSLLLCAVQSLVCHDFDLEDMGRRFVAWYREGLWTPHGKVFDIGLATSRALGRIGSGVTAELAGGDSENDNGNGSLMRIIPVALWFADEPTKSLLDRVHRASAITHRHLRSQMACGFHALIIRQLLDGSDPPQALAQAVAEFRSFYEQNQSWAAQLKHFQLLLAGDLARKPESGIQSSGYVIHTLTASLWCLLTTAIYEACVLAAVNLGGDTDTTGCVAGGLAGVYYGLPRIQERWRRSLARFDEVNSLFNHFAEDAAS